eukprot:4080657-Amphidinium_carterae.1
MSSRDPFSSMQFMGYPRARIECAVPRETGLELLCSSPVGDVAIAAKWIPKTISWTLPSRGRKDPALDCGVSSTNARREICTNIAQCSNYCEMSLAWKCRTPFWNAALHGHVPFADAVELRFATDQDYRVFTQRRNRHAVIKRGICHDLEID